MRTILHLVIAVTVIGVVSCGHAPIKPDAMTSINAVSVSPDVAIPSKVTYFGPAQTWATYVGGAAGAAIAPSAGLASLFGNVGMVLSDLVTQGFVTEPAQIKAYLARENIDVAQIARSEFVKELLADPHLGPKVGENGDAHFELAIDRYGLFQKNPASSEYKPWLEIRAKLVNSSGAILWQGKRSVDPHNGAAPTASYAAYFDDPAAFRNGFAAVARAITQRLLQDLYRGQDAP
jgi:hypothetical protein